MHGIRNYPLKKSFCVFAYILKVETRASHEYHFKKVRFFHHGEIQATKVNKRDKSSYKMTFYLPFKKVNP